MQIEGNNKKSGTKEGGVFNGKNNKNQIGRS